MIRPYDLKMNTNVVSSLISFNVVKDDASSVSMGKGEKNFHPSNGGMVEQDYRPSDGG